MRYRPPVRLGAVLVRSSSPLIDSSPGAVQCVISRASSSPPPVASSRAGTANFLNLLSACLAFASNTLLALEHIFIWDFRQNVAATGPDSTRPQHLRQLLAAAGLLLFAALTATRHAFQLLGFCELLDPRRRADVSGSSSSDSLPQKSSPSRECFSLSLLFASSLSSSSLAHQSPTWMPKATPTLASSRLDEPPRSTMPFARFRRRSLCPRSTSAST